MKKILSLITNKIIEIKLLKQKKKILKEQGSVWALKKDNKIIGYYYNPSHVSREHKELHRSMLYYYISKYGTFKKKNYELICQKY